MKKIFVLSVAMLLCVACIFAGCSKEEEGDAKETTEAVTTVADETTEAETTEADTTAADTTEEDTTEADTTADAGDSEDGDTAAGDGSALAAYAQEQEAMYEATNTDFLSVHCLVRGNSLVYTYNMSSVTDTAGAEQYLSSSLDSIYSALLSVVQLAAPECDSIVVEVLDQSGSVLASKTYTA